MVDFDERLKPAVGLVGDVEGTLMELRRVVPKIDLDLDLDFEFDLDL